MKPLPCSIFRLILCCFLYIAFSLPCLIIYRAIRTCNSSLAPPTQQELHRLHCGNLNVVIYMGVATVSVSAPLRCTTIPRSWWPILPFSYCLLEVLIINCLSGLIVAWVDRLEDWRCCRACYPIPTRSLHFSFFLCPWIWCSCVYVCDEINGFMFALVCGVRHQFLMGHWVSEATASPSIGH